jgi:hypothetical protein
LYGTHDSVIQITAAASIFAMAGSTVIFLTIMAYIHLHREDDAWGSSVF